MARFKNKDQQRVYEELRLAGADSTSELYTSDGRPRTGAAHRVAYWRGRSGMVNCMEARLPKNRLIYACYRAGVDDRREDVRKGHPCPPADFLTYPKWTPAD